MRRAHKLSSKTPQCLIWFLSWWNWKRAPAGAKAQLLDKLKIILSNNTT